MYSLKSAIVATFVVACATRASAQEGTTPTTSKPVGPHTLLGVAYDTTGNSLEGADVRIDELRLHVYTSNVGAFRFNNVPNGKYHLTARKIGYLPQVRVVTVDDGGGARDFSLVPYARGLAPVVVAADRKGLSGVVGDTAYMIVPGATVTVIAGGHQAVTDSAGAFYMDLKPGPYLLRISRPGFVSKLASVTIPDNQGRRINLWLTPGTRAQELMESLRQRELRERLLVRNAVWDKIYTHDDIAKHGFADLTAVATHGAVARVNEACMASLDGGTRMAPLWTLSADELEFVEIGVDKQAHGGVPHGKSSTTDSPNEVMRKSLGCPRVTAWLRK